MGETNFLKKFVKFGKKFDAVGLPEVHPIFTHPKIVGKKNVQKKNFLFELGRKMHAVGLPNVIPHFLTK